MTGRLHSITFAGPSGSLEGLWKEAQGERRGSAVFAPSASPARRHHAQQGRLPGGPGLDALRFLHTALQLPRRGAVGGPLRRGARRDRGFPGRDVRGRARREAFRWWREGFRLARAVGLKAIAREKNPKAAAFVALGLPLATESGRLVPRPSIPALYVAGERDAFGPPEDLERFVAGSGTVAIVPGAGSLLRGQPRVGRRNHRGVSAALPSSPRSRRRGRCHERRAGSRPSRGRTCSALRAGRWRRTFAASRRRACPRTARRHSGSRAGSS